MAFRGVPRCQMKKMGVNATHARIGTSIIPGSARVISTAPKNPAPAKRIASLFFEKIAHTYIASGILLIAVWAIIEELLKYAGAYIVAFRKVCLDGSRCLDEPVDPLIYLITAALGFSALENTLFLIGPLESGNMLVSLLTGNLRFIGATVLHVVASASIGVAMGFTFYRKWAQKKTYLLIGIFTAILLHALFNLFIIVNKGENIFVIFGFLWVAVIVLLVLFERIKRIKHNHV